MRSLSNLIELPVTIKNNSILKSDDGKYFYYHLTVSGKDSIVCRWQYFLSSKCTEKRKVIRQKWKLTNQIKKYHRPGSVSFD